MGRVVNATLRRLIPRKETRYLLYGKLGGLQGQSGWVRTISIALQWTIKLNSNQAAVETWNLKGRTEKLKVFVNKLLMWKFQREVIWGGYVTKHCTMYCKYEQTNRDKYAGNVALADAKEKIPGLHERGYIIMKSSKFSWLKIRSNSWCVDTIMSIT